MRYFTDSPYERLMQEVPDGMDLSPAVLPESHFCYGCAHYGGCCFALCHRRLDKMGNTMKQEFKSK